MPSKTMRIVILIMFYALLNTFFLAVAGQSLASPGVLAALSISVPFSALTTVYLNDMAVWIIRYFNIGVWKNDR